MTDNNESFVDNLISDLLNHGAIESIHQINRVKVALIEAIVAGGMDSDLFQWAIHFDTDLLTQPNEVT